MKSWALCLVVFGCVPASQPFGTFIRDVYVQGNHLVIERCEIEHRGDDFKTGTCTAESRPLPITADLPRVPGKRRIAAAITPAIESEAAACARAVNRTGAVPLQVQVNAQGRLIAVRVVDHDEDLEDCIGLAFSKASYPVSRSGATFEYQLDVPGS